MKRKEHHKIVFLDRDGVINEDSPDYIKSWSEFKFIDGSLDAIRRLTENGFTIIVITNQSVINRGMVPEQELHDIFFRMKSGISAAGGKITDIFYCPHTPSEGCDCRKPLPGLILNAQKKYDLDLSSAVMVGDSAKDILCAKQAGCRAAILVRTGNYKAAEALLARENIDPDTIVDNLLAASDWIVKHYGT